MFQIHFFFSSDDNIENIIKEILKNLPNNVSYNLDDLEQSIKAVILNSISIQIPNKQNSSNKQNKVNDTNDVENITNAHNVNRNKLNMNKLNFERSRSNSINKDSLVLNKTNSINSIEENKNRQLKPISEREEKHKEILIDNILFSVNIEICKFTYIN